MLWLPVMVAIGVGGYFSWPVEPPWWAGGTGVVVAAAGARAMRRWQGARMPLLGLALVAIGVTAAQGRTAWVTAPVLDGRVGPTAVVGRVVDVETRAGNGLRLTLDHPRLAGVGPERTPERVRVSLRGAQPAIGPGDWVRVRAVLTAPPAPAAPGAFDFQRQAFFRQLGAVGFAYGKAEVTARGPGAGAQAWAVELSRLRHAVASRVRAGLDGVPGAVAAALMTGERGAIPEPVMERLRDSGLAHLLAISGLHIGLVAAIVFGTIRGGLALVPPLALRWPIKKVAAAAAIAGAFAYAVLAGATVPTVRAFLMVALVLVAVLVDRRGLSLRMVAWAALVILLVQPEALLGASFQLSFAAVVALVAAWEELVPRWSRRVGGAGIGRRAAGYLGGVAVTTLVAGTATAPFTVYHFNRLASFGLAANLVAVPLAALWIMPWAVAAFVLMPWGLETWALVPMGWGIEGVLAVAETVAGWPGAVSLWPAMPSGGLVLVTAGGLWLCLWRRRWRVWGLAALVLGMASVALTRPPDVLIDERARLMAVGDGEGRLWLSSRRTARFERDIWLRRAGLDAAATERWPKPDAPAPALACDALGCVFEKAGRRVALVWRGEALLEDCRLADVVVSAVPVRRRCRSAVVVVDRFALWREGAHALWIDDDGSVRVESVDARRGDRPWVARRGRTADAGM